MSFSWRTELNTQRWPACWGWSWTGRNCSWCSSCTSWRKLCTNHSDTCKSRARDVRWGCKEWAPGQEPWGATVWWTMPSFRWELWSETEYLLFRVLRWFIAITLITVSLYHTQILLYRLMNQNLYNWRLDIGDNFYELKLIKSFNSCLQQRLNALSIISVKRTCCNELCRLNLVVIR